MKEIVSKENAVVQGKTSNVWMLCDCSSCSVPGDGNQRKRRCFPGSSRWPWLSASSAVPSSRIAVSAWAVGGGKEDAIPVTV